MIADIFLMSLDALRSHKIRTFLTLIGVIIGIGSVIIVTTAGSSVRVFIEEQWNIFNPTGMVIGIGTDSDPPQISFREIGFTDHDIDELKKLPYIKEVVPIGFLPLKAIKIREGFLNWQSKAGGTMYATTPGLLDIMGMEIEEGRMFQNKKSEIVMSRSMTKLFGVNKELKVGDTLYIQRLDGKLIKTTLVGILRESETSNVMSQVTSLSIAGPVDPYYTSYFGSNVGGIIKRVTAYGILYAGATDKEHVDDAKEQILGYLNTKSDAINYKDKNSDFVVITQQYIISKVDQIMNVMSMLITSIALVSLLVGGIGIANIMFATVTERTREIGTMMAIGAKRRDIMTLFLYQSAMIGLFGGVLGVVLGASGGAFIVQILNQYMVEFGGRFSSGNIPLTYSIQWFLIAVFFGVMIGIIAGVLPARKAAKMDPVVALRYS
ncbi:MAG: ABC transporter permease [Candidatus Thermoplasmatota archaeon]|nr:ABC transporter permease [Candidatus Thermoplasmatota archaeon]